MGNPLPRPAVLNARLDAPIEEWPYLDMTPAAGLGTGGGMNRRRPLIGVMGAAIAGRIEALLRQG